MHFVTNDLPSSSTSPSIPRPNDATQSGGAVRTWSFAAFLAAQPDLGTKWMPRFVRVAVELPVTETSKVLKRVLRRERWECGDELWWQPQKGAD